MMHPVKETGFWGDAVLEKTNHVVHSNSPLIVGPMFPVRKPLAI